MRPNTLPLRAPNGSATCVAVSVFLTLIAWNETAGMRQAPSAATIGALDAYMANVVRESGVPGGALAIVAGGKIALAKGYGVRELGKPARLDSATVFDIASLTKGFTAAAIATLVDEGKLMWDDPVRKLLPAVQFTDSALTNGITLRDLLAHRTGLAARNSAVFLTGFSRDELIKVATNVERIAPIRSRWNYSNLGYTIAGIAASRVAGTTWEQLVTDRVVTPLDLNCTTADFLAADSLANLAVGHSMFSGVQRPVPRDRAGRVASAPAGSVQTCIMDLARWMLFQLGDGTWNGKRIVSADAMSEMHAPQVFVPTTEAFRTSRQLRHFAAYGFGWQVFDYRGHLMLWHSGSGDGQVAYCAIFPDDGIAVAVLFNSWKVDALLNVAVVSRAADALLGLPARDYVAEWLTQDRTRRSSGDSAARALAATREATAAARPPLTRYLGRYVDQMALTWNVFADGDTLRVRYERGYVGTLIPWRGDTTFRVRWANPLHADDGERPLFISFTPSPSGAMIRLKMDPGPFRDFIDARRR
jgi:CubicO group peptidase (beta-lactamase class C family)